MVQGLIRLDNVDGLGNLSRAHLKQGNGELMDCRHCDATGARVEDKCSYRKLVNQMCKDRPTEGRRRDVGWKGRICMRLPPLPLLRG